MDEKDKDPFDDPADQVPDDGDEDDADDDDDYDEDDDEDYDGDDEGFTGVPYPLPGWNLNFPLNHDPYLMADQMRPYVDDEGHVDMSKLMGGLRASLAQSMAGADPASGMNWQATGIVVANLVAFKGSDPTQGAPSRQLMDTFGLANLWLDEAMAFDGATLRLELWSRTRWVEKTMNVWRSLCSPVIARLGDALIDLANENLPLSSSAIPELASMGELITPMMRSTASEFYTGRLARAIANLACTTLSGNDTSLPLVAPPVVALLPRNIEEFTADLATPSTDTSVYLLMRESARQRLFAATPWLGPQILALIEHYAREIIVDPSALREGFEVESMDKMTPQKLAEISVEMENRLFQPATTPDQQAVLTRLETLISLVEGWVDTVVDQAAGPWLASSDALAETIRRRRAAQGPAERALSLTVGLELSSRRVRDAANLWAALTHDRGIAERDAIWRHPDMLPQAEDLDDVLGFVARTANGAAPDAMDAQLNWLVDQWRKDADR